MQIRELFPTHVAVARVADADDLNRELMAEIEQVRTATPNTKPSGWACDLYTTFPGRLALHREFPAFARLGRIAVEHVEQYAAHLGVDMQRAAPVIPECWLNVYGSGNAQEMHNHGGFHVSAVYYVQAPPGCGRINFYTPLIEDQFAPLPCLGPEARVRAVESVQPEDGTLVIFQSWLRHAAAPNDIERARISVAMNAVFMPRQAPPGPRSRLA